MPVFYGKICFSVVAGVFSGDLLWMLLAFMFGSIFDLWLTKGVRAQRKIDEWLHDFSYGVIALHGYIAKLDGKVTPEEIKMFRRHMNIPHVDEESVAFVFNSARRGEVDIDEQITRLADLTVGSSSKKLLQTVLLTLYRIAMCDGGVKPAQLTFLQKLHVAWGFSVAQVKRIESQSGFRMASGGKDGFESQSEISNSGALSAYYKVLGLKNGASETQVKKKYRELIRKHHPDKIRGSGASDKDVRKAEEKIAEINVAYDAIVGE